MTDVVGIRYAKAHWARLIAEVEASGSDLVLTRRGKPIVKIVKLPPSDAKPADVTPSEDPAPAG